MGLFSSLKATLHPPSKLQEIMVEHMRAYLAFKKASPGDCHHIWLSLTLRARIQKRGTERSYGTASDLAQSCLEETFALAVFPLAKSIRYLGYLAFETEIGSKFYSMIPGAEADAKLLAWARDEVLRQPTFLEGYHDENPGIQASSLANRKWEFKLVPAATVPLASQPAMVRAFDMDEWEKLNRKCDVCWGHVTSAATSHGMRSIGCAKCGYSFLLSLP